MSQKHAKEAGRWVLGQAAILSCGRYNYVCLGMSGRAAILGSEWFCRLWRLIRKGWSRAEQSRVIVAGRTRDSSPASPSAGRNDNGSFPPHSPLRGGFSQISPPSRNVCEINGFSPLWNSCLWRRLLALERELSVGTRERSVQLNKHPLCSDSSGRW